jgi:hypothetical protein
VAAVDTAQAPELQACLGAAGDGGYMTRLSSEASLGPPSIPGLSWANGVTVDAGRRLATFDQGKPGGVG